MHHDLTQITIRRNIDGINSRTMILGYISVDPFVVLTDFITKYFVSEYNNEELYPIGYCEFEYSIGINSMGNVYSLPNFIKHPYYDIQGFIYHNATTPIQKALCILTDDNASKVENYYNLLGVVKDKNKDIQLAIDCTDILDIRPIDGTGKAKIDALAKLNEYISDTTSDDILKVVSYASKNIIEF